MQAADKQPTPHPDAQDNGQASNHSPMLAGPLLRHASSNQLVLWLASREKVDLRIRVSGTGRRTCARTTGNGLALSSSHGLIASCTAPAAGPMLHAIQCVIHQLGLYQEVLEGASLSHSRELNSLEKAYYHRDKLLPESEFNEDLTERFFGGVRKKELLERCQRLLAPQKDHHELDKDIQDELIDQLFHFHQWHYSLATNPKLVVLDTRAPQSIS